MKVVAGLAQLFTMAAALHAADYYVSPAGDDTDPGTLASPFKTIQRAADAMRAGDTCYIREGTYREAVTVAQSVPSKTTNDIEYMGEFSRERNLFALPRLNELTTYYWRVDAKVIGEAVVTGALWSFTTAPFNSPPVFVNDPFNMPDANQDKAYSRWLGGKATDPDGDSLSYAKVSGPVWLGVAADGNITGTPGLGDLGTNTFQISAFDGTNAAVKATMNIVVVNQPPVFTYDPFSPPAANEDQAYSRWIAWNVTDAENDPISFAKVSGPAWLSVASDGNITGTPVQSDVGANVFVVSASDGMNPAVQATMNVEVIASGSPRP